MEVIDTHTRRANYSDTADNDLCIKIAIIGMINGEHMVYLSDEVNIYVHGKCTNTLCSQVNDTNNSLSLSLSLSLST